jgi:hypothetical protein
VRARTTAAIVGIFLAGGLTAWGNPCVGTLCNERIEKTETVVAAFTDRVIMEFKTRFGTEEQVRRPGPTYALIVTEDMVVGVDREGYVSSCGTSSDKDLAALTGLEVAPDSVGERLGMPELALGLAIVGAFDRSEDMPELLSEVYVGDLENPRVVLCGGVTVEIGTGDYRAKIARLRQILLQAPELGIRPTRVDMRFGAQVIVEYERMKQQPRKEV